MDKVTDSQQKVVEWLQHLPNISTDQFFATTYVKVTKRYGNDAALKGLGYVIFTTVDNRFVRTSLNRWNQHVLADSISPRAQSPLGHYEPIYSALGQAAIPFNSLGRWRYIMINYTIQKYAADGTIRAEVKRYMIYCFNFGNLSPNDIAGLRKAVIGATSHYLSCINFNLEAAASFIISKQDRQLDQFIKALYGINVPGECSVCIQFDLTFYKWIVVAEQDANHSLVVYRGGSSSNSTFLVRICRIGMLLNAVNEMYIKDPTAICSNKSITTLLTGLIKKDETTIMFKGECCVHSTAMAVLAKYIASRALTLV
jgi:hypothetical protein